MHNCLYLFSFLSWFIWSETSKIYLWINFALVHFFLAFYCAEHESNLTSFFPRLFVLVIMNKKKSCVLVYMRAWFTRGDNSFLHFKREILKILVYISGSLQIHRDVSSIYDYFNWRNHWMEKCAHTALNIKGAWVF